MSRHGMRSTQAGAVVVVGPGKSTFCSALLGVDANAPEFDSFDQVKIKAQSFRGNCAEKKK